MSVRKLADAGRGLQPVPDPDRAGPAPPVGRDPPADRPGAQDRVETLYVRAGMLTTTDAAAPSVREAIRRDPHLTAEQKQTLLNVYESYVGS